LRPTKGKELIKKTAQDLNISEEMVADVVNFYYSCVKQKIESLEHPTIFLHGLGTLRLSRKKLYRDIAGLEKLLASNNQEDFKKVVKYNLSKVLLEKKIKALEICNTYYKEIYEQRYPNMEE
jgi:nucleoid DNA-binding protein